MSTRTQQSYYKLLLRVGVGVLGPIQSRQQPGAEAWASSITAAGGGLRGGAGPLRDGFLSETVSQCIVFGGGTQLTVLGESPSPSFLLSYTFGQFSAVFAPFLGLVSACSQAFTQDLKP